MTGIGVVAESLEDAVGGTLKGSNGIHQSAIESNVEGILWTEGLLIDTLDKRVYVNKDSKTREVHLTPTEFNLLEYLRGNARRAVPYDEMFTKVLGYGTKHDKNLVHKLIKIHVENLRRKLGDNPLNPVFIENIREFGYRFIAAGKHAVDDAPLGSEESLVLYPLSREVYVNDDDKQQKVDLTKMQFNLLEYLMRNAGRTVPYDEISREIFGYDTKHDKNLEHKLIKFHVEHLRRKLGDNSHNPIYIENIRSVGYKFIGAQNKG